MNGQSLNPLYNPKLYKIYTSNILPLNATVEQIQTFQAKSLEKVLQSAAQTKYWNNKFKVLKLNPNEVKSVDEFIDKIPITTKKELKMYEKELLPTNANMEMYIPMKTSGSTGPKSSVWHHKQGMIMDGLISIQRGYELFGIKLNDPGLYVYPRESPVWNMEKAVGMIYGNTKFIDPRDLVKDFSKLKGFKTINSYPHIIPNMFKEFNNDKLISEFTEDLKLFCGVGDFLTSKESDYINELTGAKSINPLTSIECFFQTIYCKKGRHHPIPDKYLTHIDENNRLIFTYLGQFQGTHHLNYYGGDLAEWVKCDCGISWPAINLIGREKSSEIIKYFDQEVLYESIFETSALENGLICYDIGSERREPGSKDFDVYIKKGKNYQHDLKREIIEEINTIFLKDNEPLSVMTEIGNYTINYFFVDKIPERLRSQEGKFMFKEK